MKTPNEYPLLLKTPMVRAVLNGTKDTTRRLSNVWAKRKPGERLWVRETFAVYPELLYKADYHADPHDVKWRPSIFMPREACRIILEITELYQESLLLGMSKAGEEDSRREGFTSLGDFIRLWDKINPKAPWESNPDVWVVRFRRILP